jgi:hypothetical protein
VQLFRFCGFQHSPHHKSSAVIETFSSSRLYELRNPFITRLDEDRSAPYRITDVNIEFVVIYAEIDSVLQDTAISQRNKTYSERIAHPRLLVPWPSAEKFG